MFHLIDCQLKPSNHLTLALVGLSMLANLAVIVTTLPLWSKLLLLAAINLISLYELSKVRMRHKTFLRAMRINEAEQIVWIRFGADEDFVAVDRILIAKVSFYAVHLTLLLGTKKHTCLILADSTDRDSYRRLRVWAKLTRQTSSLEDIPK